MIFICYVLTTVVALVVSEHIELLLNNKSATTNLNIKRIVHNTDQRHVTIQLKGQRQCDHPSFVVRISGASLYFLDLEHVDYDEVEPKWHFFAPRNAQYQFSYPALDPGLHFIEVVMMHCPRFTANSFRDLCVQSFYGGENVMNLPYSFNVEDSSVPISRPRWLLGNTSANTPWPSEFVPTRYQSIPNEAGNFDTSTEDRSKHNRYDFVNLPPLTNKLHKLLDFSNATSISMINICMVGCSHAQGLAHAGQELLGQLANRVKFVHLTSRYPSEFSIHQAVDADCSYAIVGYGQWPFSWQSDYTAQRYSHEIQEVVSKIASYRAAGGGVQFFVRSLNYNPPGGRMLLCTPLDFRTPHVTQMANHIFRTAATNHSIEYIDTTHIMGPLWDTAEDWGHPKGKVFSAEIHHIVNTVFESSLQRNQAVKFESVPNVVENDAVRFTGSTTVYLFTNHTLRAFPNGATFVRMGHDFGNVKAFLETKKKYFKFGDELPSL